MEMDCVSQMRWLLSTRPLPLPLSSMPYDLSSWCNSVNLSRSTNELEIPDEIMEEGILLYFQHFHNQPYPLLTGMSHDPQALVAELPKLVLFPLLAVSLRTCQNPFFHSKEALAQMCGMLSEAAWSLLAARYSKFDFDLAYFQALCLLAQVDFASKCHSYLRPLSCAENGPKAGKPHRAQAQVALGLRLAQTRGLLRKECAGASEDHMSLGWRSVVWTLFMMDRIFSGANVRSSCVPASSFQLFLMQCAPPTPEGSSAPKEITLPASFGALLRAGSLDVVCCNIALLDIWHSALMDIFDDSSCTPIPFWRHDSPHAAIESRLLEFEMSKWSETSSQTPLNENRSSPTPLHRGGISWPRPERTSPTSLLFRMGILSNSVFSHTVSTVSAPPTMTRSILIVPGIIPSSCS